MKYADGCAYPRVSSLIWRWASGLVRSGWTSAMGWTLMWALMMNSIRARPTPFAGSLHHWKAAAGLAILTRSEEHTSDLQSLMRISYAVFCLKKKTREQNITILTNDTI